MAAVITRCAALEFPFQLSRQSDRLAISSRGITRTSFFSSPMASLTNEIAERQKIFRAMVPYFGTVQSASFFRDTSTVVKGVHRIHPLIEGIYKPAGSVYPLSI